MSLPAGNREMVLLPLAAYTVSGTGSAQPVPGGYYGFVVSVYVSVMTATTPKLDIFMQDVITLPATGDLTGAKPTGAVYYNDFARLTQITATGKYILRFESNRSDTLALQNYTSTDGTLGTSAGLIKSGPLPMSVRVVSAVRGGRFLTT